VTEELLDLVADPADIRTDPEDELGIQEQRKQKASPTALALDEWSVRRGREVLSQSNLLRSVFGIPVRPDDAPPDEAPFEDLETMSPEHKQAIDQAALAVADFHSAAFEPTPELATACEDERRQRYMRQLLETPEFQSLHQDTQLDELASEIAAGSFSQSYVTLCHQEEPEGEFQKDLQSLKAASDGLKTAQGDVSDLRDAQAAIGHGPGGAGSRMDKEALSKLFKRVRGNNMLRRIVELAGRYRRFAQSQQRKKVLHGRDDVVGVVLDGDPGRLLPHELVQLDDPDLELDAMRRLVERQSQCRDFRGIEGKARGPICVVVDESGSMSGEPIANAKAIALALAWVARHQKRWVCLVGFSGGSEGTYLALPPGKWDQEKLLEWLCHFYGGGTDCDVPLVEVPKNWEALGAPKGTTDLIIITDAQVNVPDEIAESFLAWKAQEKVKLISLVINYEPGDLRGVSDRVYRIGSLSLAEEGVQEALSV
jgi:uncharacterized protein with von Willebrand factor type A (vWA) domain